MFERVSDNADSIQQLIILGDLFDLWTYVPSDTPPNVSDIISANSNLFAQLGNVVNSLEGRVTFITGNHDMTVTQDDLNKIPSPSGYGIEFIQDNGQFYPLAPNQDIVCTHGHLFSMFCAPDTETTNQINPLPIGYYVTRAGAYLASQQLTSEKPNVAYFPDSGEPTGLNISLEDKAEILAALFDDSLATAIVDAINDETNFPMDEVIQLPAGSNPSVTTLNDAVNNYSSLLDTWENKEDLDNEGQLGLWGAYDALKYPDIDNDLSSYAQYMASAYNSKIVVMGHTHVPLDQPEQPESQSSLMENRRRSPLMIDKTVGGNQFVYANSGFNCPSIPDMQDGAMEPTFIEIEIGENDYTVNIIQMGQVGDKIVGLPIASLSISK